MTALRPVVAQYEPEVQAEQELWDAVDWNVPVAQFTHTDADAAEYEPAEHAPVTVERPEVLQYEPAVHNVQTVEPVDSWKKPAEQLVQTEAEAAEYMPATQFSQLDEPAVP